jgi:hypothetical protein
MMNFTLRLLLGACPRSGAWLPMQDRCGPAGAGGYSR